MPEDSDPEAGQVKVIVRGRLDADRTMLANERTLLAYARTMLALFVVGVSLINFLESRSSEILGWIFVALGFLTAIVGGVRYWIMRRRIQGLDAKMPKPPEGR